MGVWVCDGWEVGYHLNQIYHNLFYTQWSIINWLGRVPRGHLGSPWSLPSTHTQTTHTHAHTVRAFVKSMVPSFCIYTQRDTHTCTPRAHLGSPWSLPSTPIAPDGTWGCAEREEREGGGGFQDSFRGDACLLRVGACRRQRRRRNRLWRILRPRAGHRRICPGRQAMGARTNISSKILI